MVFDKDVEERIRKFALKNALDFGKANSSAVLGKILSEEPSLKDDLAEARAAVSEIVEEVNGLSKEQKEKDFRKYEKEFELRQHEKEEMSSKHSFALPGAVTGDFATRTPPEPGGYIQIGNAKQAILSDEVAKIYKGKLYLYFDDSNPEKCKQEYVDAMKKDFAWLGLKFDKEYYASDFIEKLYSYARDLIRKGKAYICNCELETMKKYRFDCIECEHRSKSAATNLKEFEEMLTGKIEEGKAILRYKGDMKSQNTTMRDPVLARIKDISHYRLGNKYRVWLTYDMTTPVVDSLVGITDTIRDANWNELRGELDRAILKDLGLRVYRIHLEGRMSIEGSVTSKREVRKLVADKIVSGWNDPRLLTIRALRRRGIQPEAIRSFVLRFGLSLGSSSVNVSMLLAENKKVIAPVAKHLFFVSDPVKLVVRDAHEMSVNLRLHPTSDFGFRKYQTGTTFYISREDAQGLKIGEFVGLKDLMTVVIESNRDGTVHADAAGTTTQRDKILQWVSEGHCLDCSVLIPEELLDDKGNIRKDSLKTVKGYVESYAAELKERDLVQFERFGYCVLDDKKSMQFILTSK